MRVLIASAFLFAAVAAAAEPHTLDELLRPGEIPTVALSPDGERVAYVQRPREGIADTLVVIELEGGDSDNAVRRFALEPGATGARVGRLQWVGNRRLLAAIQPDLKPRYRYYLAGFGWYVRAENLGRLYVLDALGANAPVMLEERFTVA